MQLTKMNGGALVPVAADDLAYIDSLKIGSVLEFDKPKLNRNPKFHRLFFAMLNLGFDYWEPTGGTITPAEERCLSQFAAWLGGFAMNPQVIGEAAGEFMSALAKKRAGLSAEKNFEAYRAWVIVEAGFYDLVIYPNGSIKKIAKSIKFASMGDEDFKPLYKACFGVIWRNITSQNFVNEKAFQQAINRVGGFAS